MIPYAKSALIIALAALSIFLAAQLWFVNFTNRSFLPYMVTRFALAAPDGVSDLVRPFRIIYGAGDGYFNIKYSNVEESPLWEVGKAIIGSSLQDAVFVGRHNVEELQILAAPVVIYHYAFGMSADVFAQAFSSRQRGNAFFADRSITEFNAVAVNPPYGAHDAINIFFIGDSFAWEFTLSPARRRGWYFEIDIASASGLRRRHVPTEDVLFFTTLLNPQFVYHPVLVTNPYKNHAGMLDLAFIRSRVEHFFDNPATINHGLSAAGVYSFNNLRTSVRYTPWHVIEYTSFRTMGRTSTADFAVDFSAAIAFIRADENVSNEVFLAGFERYARETVFRFDYVIDNFPIILSQPWYTGPDCTSPLSHPIEVTVENGRVVRYRKIVYSFMPDRSISVRSPMADLSGNRLVIPFGEGPHINLAAESVNE